MTPEVQTEEARIAFIAAVDRLRHDDPEVASVANGLAELAIAAKLDESAWAELEDRLEMFTEFHALGAINSAAKELLKVRETLRAGGAS